MTMNLDQLIKDIADGVRASVEHNPGVDGAELVFACLSLTSLFCDRLNIKPSLAFVSALAASGSTQEELVDAVARVFPVGPTAGKRSS